MSIHRRKTVCSWGEGIFPRLTPLLPSGQALALFLELGPMSRIIPGLAVGGRGALLDFLPTWQIGDLDQCLAELQQHGAVVDLANRLVFLPWVLQDATPANPNVVKAWKREWSELPSCPAREAVDHHVRRFVAGFGKSKATPEAPSWLPWITAWDPSIGEAAALRILESPAPTFPEDSAGPSGKSSSDLCERSAPAFPRPLPNQEAGSRKQVDRNQGTRNQDPGNGNRQVRNRDSQGENLDLEGKPAGITAPNAGPAWELLRCPRCGEWVARDGSNTLRDHATGAHHSGWCVQEKARAEKGRAGAR